MLSFVFSGTLNGIEATLVQVEVNSGESGEPKPVLVGLPTGAVKESIDRVYSAIGNSGFRHPGMKTTINLAPGHIRKEGPLYDLPIALGLLSATGQMKSDWLGEVLIAGELSLSGETRPIRGGLALAMLARKLGKRALLLPPATAEEASLLDEVEVFAVRSLDEACAFLEGRIDLLPVKTPAFIEDNGIDDYAMDFSEVKGQASLRRAVEISVAGNHNLLVIGPPGSGKSMIAKRIPTIMPELRREEYLEILQIYSASGKTLEVGGLRKQRPFRSPHHTISDVGMIGGGSIPGPGEISLAHNGVLFLDELPEFRRSTLEVLRQPLEDRKVTISRSAGRITLPASFMLVAAMNPSPCGYGGGDRHEAISTPAQIQRYRAKVSGPLLDRMDIHVEAPALTIDELRSGSAGESSATMRERIQSARDIQTFRYNGTGIGSNSRMNPAQINRYCKLSKVQGDLLQSAMEKLNLSARAYDRILKVSRTIADLSGSMEIADSHLMEAIQFRSLDRKMQF
jgi:magnesium chelatase family protein